MQLLSTPASSRHLRNFRARKYWRVVYPTPPYLFPGGEIGNSELAPFLRADTPLGPLQRQSFCNRLERSQMDRVIRIGVGVEHNGDATDPRRGLLGQLDARSRSLCLNSAIAARKQTSHKGPSRVERLCGLLQPLIDFVAQQPEVD